LAIYVYHDQILLRLDLDNFMQYVLCGDYIEGCPVSSCIRDRARLRLSGLSISMCYLTYLLVIWQAG